MSSLTKLAANKLHFDYHRLLNEKWVTTECLTSLNGLRAQLEVAEYRGILELIAGCWAGRTSETLLKCASRLEKYPKLLMSLNSLLPSPQTKILCRLDAIVDLVVIIDQSYGRIHPVGSMVAQRGSRNELRLLTSSDLRNLLETNAPWDEIQRVRSTWAPFVMELLQLELDLSRHGLHRVKCVKCLSTLNMIYDALPLSLLIHDLHRDGDHPVASGGYADVWKGAMNDRQVCLKVLRYYTSQTDRKKLFKDLSQEVLIWRQLRHPNILEFYGINGELFKPTYCMISPWIDEGDVATFLRKTPHITFDGRLNLLLEIAQGICYLHELDPPVTHADLKGANVLMSDEGHCCLADFGLATLGELSQNPTDSARMAGSIPWLAPEVMDMKPISSKRRRAITRDIYAFGCTVIEILTGQPPFSGYTDYGIVVQVLRGMRPPRPINCSDSLWKLVKACWDENVSNRPRAREIVSTIASALAPRPCDMRSRTMWQKLGRKVSILLALTKGLAPFKTPPSLPDEDLHRSTIYSGNGASPRCPSSVDSLPSPDMTPEPPRYSEPPDLSDNHDSREDRVCNGALPRRSSSSSVYSGYDSWPRRSSSVYSLPSPVTRHDSSPIPPPTPYRSSSDLSVNYDSREDRDSESPQSRALEIPPPHSPDPKAKLPYGSPSQSHLDDSSSSSFWNDQGLREALKEYKQRQKKYTDQDDVETLQKSRSSEDGPSRTSR
ncbi:hypothetical protein D9758_007151 [Tetrapyrgos nigripes]|uniref:Protein kinase domain-containing protein n=1 Tax=Tetrapyrgos nigripes TaxID=182062 RepID=A0A8H5GDS8_9AGAR|nr:hypothetical protein D9758_007151 [Tetrapyrgos nigripes]